MGTHLQVNKQGYCPMQKGECTPGGSSPSFGKRGYAWYSGVAGRPCFRLCSDKTMTRYCCASEWPCLRPVFWKVANANRRTERPGSEGSEGFFLSPWEEVWVEAESWAGGLEEDTERGLRGQVPHSPYKVTEPLLHL